MPVSTSFILLILLRFDSCSFQQATQSSFSGGAALFGGDVAVAVDHYVDGIALRVVHGCEVGVFGEHDGNGSWVVGEIFLYFLIGLEDVDGEHDQAFIGEFLGDVIDQFGFAFAVFAPGGPELEQDDFAFDRRVVELVSGRGFGAEARGGLAGFIAGEGAERNQDEVRRARGGEG